MAKPRSRIRQGRTAGQTTTEYILILFLAVSIFSFMAKTLGPIIRKAAKNQAERMEKQFSQGLYRFRIPGR